jgi:hypothetical protein
MYPVIGISASFAYDAGGSFTNDKGFIIPLDDQYVLGILNSSTAWRYFRSICSTLRGGYLELRSVHVETLPIPNTSSFDRESMSALVQQCIDITGSGLPEPQKEG